MIAISYSKESSNFCGVAMFRSIVKFTGTAMMDGSAGVTGAAADPASMVILLFLQLLTMVTSITCQ